MLLKVYQSPAIKNKIHSKPVYSKKSEEKEQKGFKFLLEKEKAKLK